MTKNEERVRAWGLYFGYPQCCIEDFLIWMDKGFAARPKIQKENSFPGFIPCKAHAKLLDTKKITIDGIIKDRICPRPFGPSDDQGVDFAWMENYLRNK